MGKQFECSTCKSDEIKRKTIVSESSTNNIIKENMKEFTKSNKKNGNEIYHVFLNCF